MSGPPTSMDADMEIQPVNPVNPTPTQTSTTRCPSMSNFLTNFFRTENEPDLDPPKYGDTSATYWNLYGSEADTYDENFVDDLRGNTGSMVFLNSLFSSIVGSFIIEIYKTLQPSNGQSPSPSVVRINIVLFLSFFLSVMSAIGCALILQWCDEYKKFAYPRANPHTRGRVRTYLFKGLKTFHMLRFMNVIHALLHISVFLFFWALGDFFYIVDHHFGNITRYALVVAVMIYTLLSVLPLMFMNCPYNTPLTRPLRAAFIFLRIIIRSPVLFIPWRRRDEKFTWTGLRYYDGIHFDRAHLYSIEAGKEAKKLEPYAMKWLFTENDFSDRDMDKFLEGLPGYISSKHTENDQLAKYLTDEHITTRIKGHFITCATAVELSEEESITRVFSCVNALRLIFEISRKRHDGHEHDKILQSQQKFIQDIIKNFKDLCDSEEVDPTMTLRASCIRSLAVQGLVSQLVSSASEDGSQFPMSLIPIYDFFFPDNTWHEPNDPEKRLWNGFLHDVPLANLTMLAKAVRKWEHVSPSIHSFCWKTFDKLLVGFGTIRSDSSSDDPNPAQKDFDTLHNDIREYVLGEEMGFRMTKLLEILDIVDRGRRLLMVFSSRPKYNSRASVVFGKEYLRNDDLLEAFANCLPNFVVANSTKPEVCTKLMENVVHCDHLWSHLQLILWNTQMSTCPTSDKFRVFEWCCNVLDAAFSILEDSREVDWRAPEFGSLWQHFESFVTYGFHGAFVGRAASFRIGTIKARFCKALLPQFCKNIVSFRSQWDVAALAKLIHYLGLRDEDDPKFWDSCFNGGHAGEDLVDKALKMVKIIESDGSLSIFCQLGHLIISTIPSRHSDLKRKDVEKVFELQDKLVANPLLPLNGASDNAWEDLKRLRKRVESLRGMRTGGVADNAGTAGEDSERDLLQSLLRKIDFVRELCPTRSEGPGHGGLAEERPRTISQEFYGSRGPIDSGYSGSVPPGNAPIILANPIISIPPLTVVNQNQAQSL